MYKRVSSKLLLSHPRITVMEDTVELPGGQIADYLWIDRKNGAVTVIARNSAGRILVEREYSYLPNEPVYQFPGGGMNEGEAPEESANRELTEEVGLFAGRLTLLHSYFVEHRTTTAKMHLFLAEKLAERKCDTHDIYEVDTQALWLTEDEIDSLIAQGKVVTTHMLACWTLYKAGRRK